MQNKTAAALIIGNEILSGRTLDTNTQEIAKQLCSVGVDLLEARTVPDHKTTIVNTVRELSRKYDYLFTTGGIGPTHDDITSESIAEAFNVKCIKNDDIYQILADFSASRNEELNPSRAKMAYIPEGAKLLDNHITLVPGFFIKNVFTMAGIPSVMKDMLQAAIKTIKHGTTIKSKSIEIKIGESFIAKPLAQLQDKYPSVDIGSYPFQEEGVHGTSLVLRSNDYDLLDESFDELKKTLSKINKQ